jgi:RNA polymerase sigma factor (sigma-70 family)
VTQIQQHQTPFSKAQDFPVTIGSDAPVAQKVTHDRLQKLYTYRTNLINKITAAFPDLENDAEDIVQETIIKIWQRHDFEHFGTPGFPMVWLIAKRTALDELRRRSARPPLEDIDAHSEDVDYGHNEDGEEVGYETEVLTTHETPEDIMQSIQLWEMASALFRTEWSVQKFYLFNMRYKQGLPNKEIARISGLSEGTVGRILAECEARLSQVLFKEE